MAKYDLVNLGLVSWTQFFWTAVIPSIVIGYIIAFVQDGE